MTDEKKPRGRVETVFVLMLFCVFAVSVFLVLILSASAYQNMNELAAEGENERVVLSYVRTKVRNNDNAESVSVTLFGDVSALVIEEYVDGEPFFTIIYYHNGWAYELFMQRGAGLGPGAGNRFVRVESLDFYLTGGGAVRAVAGSYSALIFPRSIARTEPIDLDDYDEAWIFDLS